MGKVEYAPVFNTAIGRVPAILNNAQQRILQAASTFPVSLIVGPPGTGKSYTIAALAIEHLSKGQSVLIASRTDQAVDVLADKIENQLGIKKVIIRGGRKNYMRDLHKHLENILSGIVGNPTTEKQQITKLDNELKKLARSIKALENEFQSRVEKECDWGRYMAKYEADDSFFINLKRKYINWRNDRQDPHWKLIKDLEIELETETRKTIEFVENSYHFQVAETLRTKRADLQQFLKALKAKSGNSQEKYFAEVCFNTILKTFPIWLVKMSDIYKILPFQTEMFDLAIIDEATQCDIASCIPIMQRAKRVVIAGDPNQLRHVSFLSGARQEMLAKKFEVQDLNPDFLNYRDKSILDIITDSLSNQDQVVFLDEHYRSTPYIIRFSNRKFYSGALKIMTEKPGIPVNEGIVLKKCNGTRTKQGYNVEEATVILETVHEIINNQRDMGKETCQSIGILSPFRNQADYITAQISRDFTIEEIEKHHLTVGTAYAFQGEERDVMLLSFVLDKNSHPTAFFHLNKSDVFNVSVTRARSLQYICYSVETKDLKFNSFFREYIESYEQNKAIVLETPKIKDKFLHEVQQELETLGVKTFAAYHVAGQILDLVIQYNTQTYGIDLIGYPGEFEEAFPLERYKMLNRAGIHTFPLPYTYWVSDRMKCLEDIQLLVGI